MEKRQKLLDMLESLKQYRHVSGRLPLIDRIMFEEIEKDVKLAELLKKHIFYCKNVDGFVLVSIDPETKKKLKELLNNENYI